MEIIISLAAGVIIGWASIIGGTLWAINYMEKETSEAEKEHDQFYTKLYKGIEDKAK